MASALGYQDEECGAPPIPHASHFRVAILRGLGVVEDAVNRQARESRAGRSNRKTVQALEHGSNLGADETRNRRGKKSQILACAVQ